MYTTSGKNTFTMKTFVLVLALLSGGATGTEVRNARPASACTDLFSPVRCQEDFGDQWTQPEGSEPPPDEDPPEEGISRRLDYRGLRDTRRYEHDGPQDRGAAPPAPLTENTQRTRLRPGETGDRVYAYYRWM